MSRRILIASRGGPFAPPASPADLSIGGPYGSAWAGSRVLTQLHCHTTASDGSYSAATIVAGYLAAGYGALAITDHDKVTAQPAGITTVITGNELSPTTQHIISMNSSYTRGADTDAQTILDDIATAGGIAEVAHPKWYRGMTFAEMSALTGYLGFEIHNGHCIPGSGQNPVTYPGYAIDRWDDLLRAGRRDLWGFAVDDLHSVGAFTVYDMGRLQVFAASNTLANVVAAMEAGEFVADVANFGVTPGYPERDADGIALSCTGATRIEAWGADGLLTATDGSSHTHPWDGSEQYVRLVAIGDYSEPFSSALSDRWQAVDGTWSVGSGVLSVSTDGTGRRLILRRHRQADFTAQVDVNLSDGGTDAAGILFNVLNSSYYFLVRIGESAIASWNNRLAFGYTTSNNLSADPLGSYAFTASPATWYTIKMAYTASTGAIAAKVWVRGETEPADWQATGSGGTWRHGGFGLRANRTCQFDNLAIDGFQTFYQPVTVDLAA